MLSMKSNNNNQVNLSLDQRNMRGFPRHISPGAFGGNYDTTESPPRSSSTLIGRNQQYIQNLGYPAPDPEEVNYNSIRERGLSSSLKVHNTSNTLNPIQQHSVTSIAKSPHLQNIRQEGGQKRLSSQLQNILNNQRNVNSIENVNLVQSLKPGWTPQRRRNADLVDALQTAKKRYEIQQLVQRENYKPELYKD
eukprot:CAMPEP_0197005414 /NCGR_PEP_ID=MMETSP1380-20130617/29265_1 /TAXON_ID=5936 /ORGANISM="Euplotes crassus, Strain CT5" /LENGTH=192 /DNA_ID=CAMNT_0042424549 /DNA_START=14 /DNA_END=589 /DNA_ORIENTATION=-